MKRMKLKQRKELDKQIYIKPDSIWKVIEYQQPKKYFACCFD